MMDEDEDDGEKKEKHRCGTSKQEEVVQPDVGTFDSLN